MNTILFYTIVIIVILIVCFFLARNTFNKNNTIENFDPNPNPPDHTHHVYGVKEEENAEITDLENHFYSAVRAIEPGKNDQCLSKFIHMFDLAISDTAPETETPSIEIEALTDVFDTLNSCLENFDGAVLYVTGEDTLTMRKVTNFETDFNNETTIFDSKIYEPHRHKFSNAPDFIDFGVKTKHNYFIKKYKYRIPDDKKVYLFNDLQKNLKDKINAIKTGNTIKRVFDKESVLYFVNEVKFIYDISHKQIEDYNETDVLAEDDKRYKYYVKLMKLRNSIIEDKFLEKFNCKYFTYLFYSFNDGWNIFGNYISQIFDTAEIEIMKEFFEDINLEGLYKLFILSMKHENCHIIGENEHLNKPSLDNILKPNFFIPEYNNTAGADNNVFEDRLELYVNFNTRHYFFYSDLNYDGMVLGCSKINQEDKCTPDLTFNQCIWNGTKNKCEVANNFSFEKCMDYNSYTSEADRGGECEANPSCYFDDTNGMCYPKPCLEKDTNTNELKCATHNHCQNYPEYRIENGEYKSHCYDNERVMYATKSEDGDPIDADSNDLPQNFMTKVDTHLSDCTVSDRPLSSSCKNTAITSCKILDKEQPRFNPSKFETCVSEELIDKDNFHNCFNLKTKESCDTAYGSNVSCFWQDGKCYKRDAPLEWRNPDSREFGLEDMTDCKNFISEFECPVDRCIWYGKNCIRKNEHPYYPTGPIEETDDQNTPDITVPLDRDNVDCLAINNQANEDIDDAKNECLHNKCHWDREKSLCMNDINRFCELHNSEASCLDGLTNFDPVSHQNQCRWVEDKTGKFTGTAGFCIDTRMKQPCALFDKESCPVEDKVDNMGNVIRGSAHCKLDDNNKCVNKDSNFIDDYNSCHYDYLNAGKEVNSDLCQLNENLYSSNSPYGKDERTSVLIQKMTPRQLLPCSALSVETDDKDIIGCNNQNITNGKCLMDLTNNKCTYPKTLNDIETILGDITNPDDQDYRNIKDINERLNEMEYITNENKKFYIKERGTISGLIIQLIEDSNGNQFLQLDTDSRISNITINDTIIIKDSSDKELFKVSVESVDVVNQQVKIKNLDQQSPDGKIRTDLGTGATWTLNNPNLGLFGSYQQAQALIDSKKINDFYNNFL